MKRRLRHIVSIIASAGILLCAGSLLRGQVHEPLLDTSDTSDASDMSDMSDMSDTSFVQPGEIRERYILNDGLRNIPRAELNTDTLLHRRWTGEWWFGGFGGTSHALHIGSVQAFVPPGGSITQPVRVAAQGFTTGFHAGLIAEWQPHTIASTDVGQWLNVQPYQHWGAQVRLMFGDVVNGLFSAQYQEYMQRLAGYTDVVVQPQVLYATLAPSVRYALTEPTIMGNGLYVFGGIECSLLMGSEMRVRHDIRSVRTLNQPAPEAFEPLQRLSEAAVVRVGVHGGLGWDIFQREMLFGNTYADGVSARLKWTPYFMLQAGTAFASSWNALTARLGIALTVAQNQTASDTLRWKPAYMPKAMLKATTLPSALAVAAISEAFLPVQGVENRPVENRPSSLPIRADIVQPVFVASAFVVQRSWTLEYESLRSTAPTNAMHMVLNEIIAALNADGDAIVHVAVLATGLSFAQRTKLIEARWQAVVEYVEQQGIPRTRLANVSETSENAPSGNTLLLTLLRRP